jgi:hypothetical protein
MSAKRMGKTAAAMTAADVASTNPADMTAAPMPTAAVNLTAAVAISVIAVIVITVAVALRRDNAGDRSRHSNEGAKSRRIAVAAAMAHHPFLDCFLGGADVAVCRHAGLRRLFGRGESRSRTDTGRRNRQDDSGHGPYGATVNVTHVSFPSYKMSRAECTAFLIM